MNIFKSKNVKVTPSVPREESSESFLEMSVVRLHTQFRRYGGQRHPKLASYEEFKSRGEIFEYKYVPPDSTIVYVSHEWVGIRHPDPSASTISKYGSRNIPGGTSTEKTQSLVHQR